MKHIKPASVILLGLVSLTAACQQKPVEAPKTAATMTEDQKAIYAYGAAIGQQLAEQNKQLRLSPEELEVFRTAFGDTVSGKEPAVKIEEYETRFRELAQARIAANAADAKKSGEEFLASAASKEGAVKTESGLVFRTITPGKGGDHPKATDVVTVHYQGTLPDGTSSTARCSAGSPPSSR